jgi:hypothetical protein
MAGFHYAHHPTSRPTNQLWRATVLGTLTMLSGGDMANLLNRPNMRDQLPTPESPGGSNERGEVIPHAEQRDHVRVVLDLLPERIRKESDIRPVTQI